MWAAPGSFLSPSGCCRILLKEGKDFIPESFFHRGNFAQFIGGAERAELDVSLRLAHFVTTMKNFSSFCLWCFPFGRISPFAGGVGRRRQEEEQRRASPAAAAEGTGERKREEEKETRRGWRRRRPSWKVRSRGRSRLHESTSLHNRGQLSPSK